jgi:cytochrome P450
MCIGHQFATMESVLIIATLAQRYEFALAPGARVGVKAAATLGTQSGMPMVVHPRRPAGDSAGDGPVEPAV